MTYTVYLYFLTTTFIYNVCKFVILQNLNMVNHFMMPAMTKTCLSDAQSCVYWQTIHEHQNSNTTWVVLQQDSVENVM